MYFTLKKSLEYSQKLLTRAIKMRKFILVSLAILSASSFAANDMYVLGGVALPKMTEAYNSLLAHRFLIPIFILNQQ